MIFKDVVIIGGGASGIFCALNIPKDKKVLILDRLSLGKKILSTGNGRANLTNITINSQAYNHDLSMFFEKFSCAETVDLFNNFGLLTYVDLEGRVYPKTNYASSVVEVLNNKLTSLENVEHIKENAIKIEQNNAGNYIVYLENDKIECKYCVVACGGNASINLPKNVDILPFYPALCGLETSQNQGLNGVRISPVTVKLTKDEREIYVEENGEILFKENGISGIAIMNISNVLDVNLTNEYLSIDLLPNENTLFLNEYFNNLIKNNKYLKISHLLDGMMQSSIANAILSKAKVDFNDKITNISNDKLDEIIKIIKNYALKITGRAKNNQIFGGGVPLNDLTDNLEHKNYKNLFFTGEFVDVIGKCGGYNLQWAFTSGTIVAKSMK